MSQRLYRAARGPSLKSEGTNVCGSAGSVRSACCRGVSGTSGGGRTRARDHAIWETQYLKSRVRRSWSALHGAVPCITASENNTADPAGTSGMTTQEAFPGASWIWRGSLKLLLWLPGMELTRFRGHPIVGAERNVHDAEEPSAVPSGIPPADD